MNSGPATYPIGTPGTTWGDAERNQWLSRQTRHSSYEAEVLSVIERLVSRVSNGDMVNVEIGDVSNTGTISE